MKNETGNSVKLVLQEMKENPYQRLNLAFSLTTIIPFLVFFYILAARIATLNILVGEIGVILFISILVSLCGFCVTYGIIRSTLSKTIFYAAQAMHSDQLKSAFVATVSHELNNPLSTVKSNIFNVLSGIVGGINEEQKNILNLCHATIDRMGRLIKDLLDLHQIEAGMVRIDRKLCNLAEVAERQAEELDALFKAKSLTLIKEIMKRDSYIWADEDKITRVINNLLSNAIKFTPKGGEIFLKIYPCAEFMRLECIDTGPGIPDDKIGKLFNKFERLGVTQEGTGLGLAITKDIVEMHKGKVWAENQPDKGSKFTVVLPFDLRKTKR